MRSAIQRRQAGGSREGQQERVETERTKFFVGRGRGGGAKMERNLMTTEWTFNILGTRGGGGILDKPLTKSLKKRIALFS